MADTNKTINQTNSNEKLRSEANQADSQTVRHEQAKSEVSGGTERAEKSAIGGGGSGTDAKTGEPGRARNELDQNKDQFDKSRSEPAGQR